MCALSYFYGFKIIFCDISFKDACKIFRIFGELVDYDNAVQISLNKIVFEIVLHIKFPEEILNLLLCHGIINYRVFYSPLTMQRVRI